MLKISGWAFSISSSKTTAYGFLLIFVVNDHFADCLWMIDKKIQARYYWEYVLTLEDTEDELKKKIQNKLLFGLEKI